MMAEDVHWLPSADAADVAWKLVSVNLSDLAAKGAAPIGVLLGFMLGEIIGIAALPRGWARFCGIMMCRCSVAIPLPIAETSVPSG